MHYLQIIRKLYNLPEADNHGYPESALAALEERLQIRIPAALREYYLSLGANRQINDSFNRLTAFNEMGFSEDEHRIFCQFLLSRKAKQQSSSYFSLPTLRSVKG